MRRVGLIDITVGNAARLGASQRSTRRRCVSHHIATQRVSRSEIPAALARLAGTSAWALVMTDDRFKQGALSVYVGFENCAWLQVRRTSELNDEQHLSTYLTADGVTSEDKN